jgi:hypothetical protein
MESEMEYTDMESGLSSSSSDDTWSEFRFERNLISLSDMELDEFELSSMFDENSSALLDEAPVKPKKLQREEEPQPKEKKQAPDRSIQCIWSDEMIQALLDGMKVYGMNWSQIYRASKLLQAKVKSPRRLQAKWSRMRFSNSAKYRKQVQDLEATMAPSLNSTWARKLENEFLDGMLVYGKQFEKIAVMCPNVAKRLRRARCVQSAMLSKWRRLQSDTPPELLEKVKAVEEKWHDYGPGRAPPSSSEAKRVCSLDTHL